MDEINIEKVQYLLLMHEQRLAVKNTSSSSVFGLDFVHANLASQWSRNGNGSNRWGFLNIGGSIPRGGGLRGGRGRGRPFGRRICHQLCGKPSHFMDRCYHRFDRNVQCTSSQNFGPQFGRSGGVV